MTLISGMVQRRGGSTLPSLDILRVYDDWESPTNAKGENWLQAILSASEVSKGIPEDWMIWRDLPDGSSVLTHVLELSLTAPICNEEEMTKLIQMCPNLQSLTYSDYGYCYKQPSDAMPPRMTAKDVVECLVPRQKTLRSLELSMSFPATQCKLDQFPQEWMISDLRERTELQELTIDRYDLVSSWGVERQYTESGRNGCFDFLHGCRVERALEILERPSSPFLWKLPSSLRTLCIERGDRSLLPELERLPEFIVARGLPDLRNVSLPKWFCQGLHGGVPRLKALGEELWKEHGVIFKVELKGDYTSPPHWLCWPADSVVCSQK
ncbi:hypothetical protein LTR64_007959 [Lithohypha guttulata]|uniref:uncharacterized protein n=1 Tax=Lithohypha guttulata TaxID=1690604 RepID=UPI002DE0C7BC|nr:hypothetical protein LTR51_008172 [Lithohypha guttulata]